MNEVCASSHKYPHVEKEIKNLHEQNFKGETMCGSRKYPYPHHGGNWKFRRGGGFKDQGNSRGEGGCMISLVSRGPLIQYGFQKSFLNY